MKKVLALVSLITFVVVVPVAMAAEEMVNCCVKRGWGEEGGGKLLVNCKKVSKTECTEAKGKIVKDCKECK